MSRWKLSVLSLAALVLFQCATFLSGDISRGWASAWALILAPMLATFLWQRMPNDRSWLVMPAAYFIAIGVMAAMNPSSIHHYINNVNAERWLRLVSAQATLVLVVAVMVFIFLDSEFSPVLRQAFGGFLILDAVVLIATTYFAETPRGFLNNPAMDATLIVAGGMYRSDFIAAIRKKFDIYGLHVLSWILTIAVLWASASSTAFFMWVVVITTSVIVSWHDPRAKGLVAPRWAVASVSLALFGVAYALAASIGDRLLNSSGRFEMWEIIWHEFTTSSAIYQVAGYGLGTFEIYGPQMQRMHDYLEGSFFIWAHNDWLQILWESGWVGLGMALVVAGGAVWTSWKKRNWNAMLMLALYGLMMTTQMPLRTPAGVVLLILILRDVTDSPHKCRAKDLYA